MRLPEMYFIVAECEIMKSGGNKEIAKARINDIRKRAAVPGKPERVLEFCSFQFFSDLNIGIGFGGYIVCDICNSCYCA